jgi:hypothetical protein
MVAGPTLRLIATNALFSSLYTGPFVELKKTAQFSVKSFPLYMTLTFPKATLSSFLAEFGLYVSIPGLVDAHEVKNSKVAKKLDPRSMILISNIRSNIISNCQYQSNVKKFKHLEKLRDLLQLEFRL